MLPQHQPPPRIHTQFLVLNKDATTAESRKFTSLYGPLSRLVHSPCSYIQLARKYHPDTNPDANARDKFVEIQEAYDVSSNYFVPLSHTQSAVFRS